jgi:iron complex outermembrane receptor protein
MSPRGDFIGGRRLIGLFLSLALCGGADAFADPPQANSDPSTSKQQPSTLDTIYVTGTHIRGVDLETEHPLVVLKRKDLLRTGLTGVADIVQSLIVANGQTLNRNINNGGSGELRVNLRSLGANRTLVLVNGQRFVSAVDGAVDLSAIPLALVERIEVLKDGASAIYGSDAIGGVVNIITRRDFHGAELGLYAGETDHGDGFSRHADFSFGRSGEQWNASFGLEYGKDGPVFADARRISSVPSPGLPLAATSSPSSQYGVFGIPALGGRFVLIPGRAGTSPDDFKPYSRATDNNYNFIPYNYLQTPQERRAGFGQFRWEFSPTLAFSMDALFNQRRSAQQLAPPVVGFDPDPFDGGFTVSPDNVYNPFGVPVIRVFTRWPDSLPRRFEQTVVTTRFHLRLSGLLGAFGREWEWGVDAARTQARQREFASPYADNDRLRLAVGPSFFGPDGVAHCGTPAEVIPGCVPLDLFTGPGRFTQPMLDYVDVDVTNRKRARSDALDFHITGALAELPAGQLGFAAGIERRLERGSDQPDPLVASNRANGTGVTFGPTDGAYAVDEAYVEFDLPLLAQKPFARELDVNLATRFSDYSQFGSTDNSRIGLRWKPADELLFRATWSQGFRAPSIFEAYGGAVHGPSNVSMDVCAADPAANYTPPPAVAANCLAHGVPADVSPYFDSTTTTGSNPDLEPETSRSLTTGVVYSPQWLPGLDASLDWYRIEIRNAIGNLGDQAVLNACYVAGDPAACSRITRNPDGTLARIEAINQNLPGGIETEGWDFALSWQRTTRFGDIELRWDNAYVTYWGDIGKPARGTSLPDGSLAQGNVVGTHNDLYGVIWRLRSIATLAWHRGGWGASISGRYFSPIVEGCFGPPFVAGVVGDPSLRLLCSDPGHVQDGAPDPRNRVGAVTYVDLEASWRVPWRGTFTLGVRNAFDREPPLARSYGGANSFFPDYDVPGRFLWLSYRQKL